MSFDLFRERIAEIVSDGAGDGAAGEALSLSDLDSLQLIEFVLLCDELGMGFPDALPAEPLTLAALYDSLRRCESRCMPGG